MTSKFSRFMNLERSRAERPSPQEPTRLQSGNRFETLARRSESPQEASVPETHLERFRGQAPLALEDLPTGEPRFPRCGSCQSDNGRFANECSSCGADLTTPQQRAFNEQLWQQRQQELVHEKEALAALSQQRKEQERTQQDDSAQFAEMLKKLREEEHSGSLWRRISVHDNIALALLSFIPSQLLRGLILTLLILIPLGMWRFGRGSTRFFGAVLGFFVIILILPTGDNAFRRWRR